MFVSGLPFQLFCSVCACLIVLAVGTSVGWTAPTLKKLKMNTSEPHLTESEGSWIAAMHEPGHILAAIPAGFLISKWGPLACLRVAGVFSIIGWCLILAKASFFFICAGRIFFGLSMGIAFTVVPLYLGEVASPKLRGGLTTCFQAMLYFGHLVEFVLGPWLSYTELAIVSLCIPITFLVMSFLIVESPYFLLKQGRYDEAGLVYSKLSGETNLQEVELQLHIMQDMISSSNTTGLGKIKEAVSGRHRNALLIVVVVAVLQRFSGMSAVVAYAAITFPNTTGGLNSSQYTILFGAIVFFFTFVAAALVDSYGRRRLTIVSCLGCCVAEAIAGLYFLVESHANTASWLPFVAITLYACFYAVGLGPVVAVLQGEMFAPDVKGVSSSIVTVAHACSSFVVTKTYHVIRSSIGVYFNFFFFSCASFSAFVYIFYFLPETKKKTLQQVQQDQDSSARRVN